MEEKDCWDKFIVSGKVEDYLKYRSTLEYAVYNKTDTANINVGDNVERNSYAYGNDISIVPS